MEKKNKGTSKTVLTKSENAKPAKLKVVKSKSETGKSIKTTSKVAKQAKATQVKVNSESTKPVGDRGQAKRNENYQKDWLKTFMILLDYKAKNGHVDVPARLKYKGLALGNWVVRQRVIKDKLTKDQRKLLKSAGFNWDPLEEGWNYKFQLLLKFYEKNRHTHVPINYTKYPELARWVHLQRKHRINGILHEDKINKLNHVHFIWDVHEHLWQKKLEKLREFYYEKGDFFIPSDSINKSLAAWKNEQIRHYKKGKLSKEHFDQLKEIGFDLTDKSVTDVKLTHDSRGKFVRVITK